MKLIKNLIMVAGIAALLSSCVASGPTAGGPGVLATSNSGTKSGIAERKIFLFFSFGETDLSMTTAAKNGGITKIATVDSYVKKGLFFSTYQTIVTGE